MNSPYGTQVRTDATLANEITHRHCHKIRLDRLLVPRRGVLHSFLDEAHRAGVLGGYWSSRGCKIKWIAVRCGGSCSAILLVGVDDSMG